MPENARPGEAFEVVAVIQPSEDGSFTLASLDGMPMAEEEEEVAVEEEELAEPDIKFPF